MTIHGHILRAASGGAGVKLVGQASTPSGTQSPKTLAIPDHLPGDHLVMVAVTVGSSSEDPPVLSGWTSKALATGGSTGDLRRLRVSERFDMSGSVDSVSYSSAYMILVMVFRNSGGIGKIDTNAQGYSGSPGVFKGLDDILPDSLVAGSSWGPILDEPLPSGLQPVGGRMGWITGTKTGDTSFPAMILPTTSTGARVSATFEIMSA